MKRRKITQEALLQYVRQNLTNEQIAQKEEVSTVTIWNHIKKIDRDLLDKARQEGQELENIKRQERLLEYVRQNLTYEQIAEKEGVTTVTIWSYIKEIDEELLKQAEEEAKQLEQMERQKRLLEYIRDKLTREEMAEKEGVSKVTIWNYMKQIDKDLLERAKKEDEETWQQTKQDEEEKWKQIKNENEERWKLLMQGSKEKWQQLKQENDVAIQQLEQENEKEEQQKKKQSTKSKEKIEKKRSTKQNNTKLNIRRKMASKKITIDDVRSYQEELDEKYNKVTYEDIVLLMRLYIKTKKIEEAIKFLNKTIYNEDMAYLGLERLKKIKEQLEGIKKKQQVRGLIQNDKKTAEIVKVVGLSEIEIIRIKKEMEKNVGIEI